MDPVKEYGFTALPRDIKVLLKGQSNIKSPSPVKVDEIELPSTPWVRNIHKYAREELPEPTFNHSMRVFYYGIAMLREQFPDWDVTGETYFLVCLLHDIGTTPKNIKATRMSFEFYGGMIAMDKLREAGASTPQAESVVEAIIRHQDIGETGKITTIGLLVQLATIFDNIGGHAALVHEDTIKDVVKHFPRKKWSSCFASTIREENSFKPWAHTTALGEEDFPNGVLGNKLMGPYE